MSKKSVIAIIGCPSAHALIRVVRRKNVEVVTHFYAMGMAEYGAWDDADLSYVGDEIFDEADALETERPLKDLIAEGWWEIRRG